MIITADVFSRVMRETLSSTQRDEIVRELTLTYSFAKKDVRLIRAIVDYWLTALLAEQGEDLARRDRKSSLGVMQEEGKYAPAIGSNG
jgi:hypothetical protein